MIESKIKQNIPLAPLTTFKIGGPAKFFIEISEQDELIEVFSWAKKNKEKIFILAGGSNVLINDKGVEGLVVKLTNDKISVKGERIECGAGANLVRVVGLSVGASLTGLEWAINIPGTVGGAVRGNAGAYGNSIGESMETVEIFNLKKERFSIFSRKDCNFNYKESVFKDDNNLLIWDILLKLNKGNKTDIDNLVRDYSAKRQESQPNLPSAGCVFKNFQATNLEKENQNFFRLANEEKAIKGGMISAGWLIERLDIKGKTIGGAKVSLEHANFIVNTGKATAEQVIMLISYIKQQIRDKFNVQISEEIQYFGF